MMDWAEQQAIVGLIYGGITDVRGQREDGRSKLQIPFDDLMEWIGYAQDIENRNKILNKKCAEVVKEYQDAGFDCIVLKGQGNATMYPRPLLRMPGDIDVWITRDSRNHGSKNLRREITRYVKERKKVTGQHCYHIEYDEEEIPIEIHSYACNMNSPVYRRRLQRWFTRTVDGGCMMAELPDGVGRIPIPTREFNIVFQLAHMMHHFFDEGIGLRQMIDYYYLLKSDGRSQMDDVGKTLKYLNLYKFAGAVMYIMKEVLGLDEKYLIVPVDERRGKTLLEEILKGGNFGQHSEFDQNNAAKKYFQKTWRNMRFVREYPAEALCEPVFRTWHYFWRMAHNKS